MATLLHGTTRRRAEQIVKRGPDPALVEFSATGFSTCLEAGPFPLGTPADYARNKSALFPDEGGPVILTIEVPDNIVDLAVDQFFPLSQGVVQFDIGRGLDELRAARSTIRKSVIPV